VNITNASVKARQLELAIPASGVTTTQRAILDACIEYGKTVGVEVKLVKF
jgi:hypothetical protein